MTGGDTTSERSSGVLTASPSRHSPRINRKSTWASTDVESGIVPLPSSNTMGGINEGLGNSGIERVHNRNRNYDPVLQSNIRTPPNTVPGRLGCQAITDPHAYIVRGAQQRAVDPADCFPLTQTREQYGTAVDYFASQFQRLVLAGLPLSGCSSAGGLPIVVAVPRAELHLVEQFLSTTFHLNDSEIKVRARSKTWYGVIDGAHRLKALLVLQEEDPQHFTGYQWSVLEIKWHPLSELRAFSRMRNQMQRDFVEITVFDVIENIKEDAEKILERNGEVVSAGSSVRPELTKEICDSYCGAKSFSNDVMRNLTRIAIKMSRRVITHMGRILNSERQDLSTLRTRRGLRRKSMLSKNLPELDGRVFRNIINTHSFRASGCFFDREVTDEDRLHTLERLRWRAEDTQCFTGVKSSDLEFQVRKARDARKELEKLLSAAGLDKPPSGMRQVVWNLLNTTKLDEEVEKCKDHDFALVLQLEDQCRRFTSVDVSSRLDLFKRQSQRSAENASQLRGFSEAQVDVLDEDREDLPRESSERSLEGQQPSAIIGNRTSPDSPEAELENSLARNEQGTQDDAVINVLDKTNQTVHQYTWRQYELNVLTIQSHFDLVLGEPMQSGLDPRCAIPLDVKEIKEFVQFTRRILVPGGTCFLILGTHLEVYSDVVRMFRESQFETRRFYLIKDSDSVQRDVSEFPQDVVELCVVARAPGQHPDGFKYDLTSEYFHMSQCTHKRKFAIIDQIPPVSPGFKLLQTPRKSLVRPGERPVPLLMEVLLTFCPPNGKVLDAFAGVFTTSLACLALYNLHSKISCTSLEHDQDCFQRAYRRLRIVAEQTLQEEERREAERTDVVRDESDEYDLIRYDRTYCRRSKRLRQNWTRSSEKSPTIPGEEETEELPELNGPDLAPLGSAIQTLNSSPQEPSWLMMMY